MDSKTNQNPRVFSAHAQRTGASATALAGTNVLEGFGRQRTVFRDTRSRVIGSAEISAPDRFERRTTVFRDGRREATGRSGSGPPDLFGRVTTRINGASPLDRVGESGGR